MGRRTKSAYLDSIKHWRPSVRCNEEGLGGRGNVVKETSAAVKVVVEVVVVVVVVVVMMMMKMMIMIIEVQIRNDDCDLGGKAGGRADGASASCIDRRLLFMCLHRSVLLHSPPVERSVQLSFNSLSPQKSVRAIMNFSTMNVTHSFSS
ncbi:hypothetical protein ElyMa_003867200 [Elysia marginata]|uniref:Uncharacterized protein n=1 Tax=Elysia marginata TaxID=1093978 RepID=A0AAV4FK50_9GAST|nr:hypothetical protein ElyMa_003867200 [Elysia marginata]